MRNVSIIVLALLLSVLLISCTDPQPKTSLFAADAEKPVVTLVSRDKPVILPNDHKSHPAFDIEWWYLTFVLEDAQHRPYGLQFTLFRFSGDQQYVSNWSDGQLWMGHASLHSPTEHFFEERFGSGGVGNVFVTDPSTDTQTFSAQIDNWRWQSESTSLTPSTLDFTINDVVSVSLQLSADGPVIKQGDNGYSIKTADETYRSYYYSQPFIRADGKIKIGDNTLQVNGNGWFDHEWTSELANNNALGWDWFSLHLDNGDKLMAFRMHVNGQPPYVTGTYITATGEHQTLTDETIQLTPIGNESIDEHDYPVNWRLQIPIKSLDINLHPFKPGQHNNGRFPYYEGRVEVAGSHSGNGFMELTGH